MRIILKSLFSITVEAKDIILWSLVMVNLIVRYDILSLKRGRSYVTAINIFKHNFLHNHRAIWAQISYVVAIRWDNVKWLCGLDHIKMATMLIYGNNSFLTQAIETKQKCIPVWQLSI